MQEAFFYMKFGAIEGKVVTTLQNLSKRTGVSLFRLRNLLNGADRMIDGWVIFRCTIERASKKGRPENFNKNH
jgi:hypothetical protein